jgi:hypothetical protein
MVALTTRSAVGIQLVSGDTTPGSVADTTAPDVTRRRARIGLIDACHWATTVVGNSVAAGSNNTQPRRY